MGWLLQMVMLNMLLAIIMDIYTQVRAHILAMPHVETLWSQMVEILQREQGVWKGKLVRLSKVLKILDPSDISSDDDNGTGDIILTCRSLVEKVQGLSVEQAFDILLEAESLNQYEIKRE